MEPTFRIIEVCQKQDRDYDVVGTWNNKDPQAEAMIEKQLECLKIIDEKDPDRNPEWPVLGREYYIGYSGYAVKQSPWFPVHEDATVELVWLDLSVSDELNHMILIGVFEDSELVALWSCIDTMWSQEWTADFPTGLIDTSKPYTREVQRWGGEEE